MNLYVTEKLILIIYLICTWMHFPMELGRYQRARKKNIGFGVVNNVLFIWNFLNVIVIIIIIIKWMRGKEDKVMTGDYAVAKNKKTHKKKKIKICPLWIHFILSNVFLQRIVSPHLLLYTCLFVFWQKKIPYFFYAKNYVIIKLCDLYFKMINMFWKFKMIILKNV